MIELSVKAIANLLPGCTDGMQRAAASYQYILYGMDFHTDIPGASQKAADRGVAREKMVETATGRRHERDVAG